MVDEARNEVPNETNDSVFVALVELLFVVVAFTAISPVKLPLVAEKF
jgi:hypothetical protein